LPSEPKAKQFFDQVQESVQKIVGSKFSNFAVTVERDYRGSKFDALTIRVMKSDREDGKTGIVSERAFYER
jgi:hypothetical protein